MKTEPLVSIIIATYNRASMVEQAIRSALAQTYPNKQVIVIDDGSTDNTAAVVKKYSDVEYVLQPHRRQAAARNNGWRHSKGEYITTLDSDDLWEPTFLEKCVPFIEEHQLDFVFANWNQQRSEGGTFDFLSSDPLLQPYMHLKKGSWIILENEHLRDLYIKGCPSPSSSLLIRATTLRGWNEQMNIGDDWCMLLDMIMPGNCKAAFTLDILWKKQINCNNIYDGRDHRVVNRLLYVEDAETLMKRYAASWTKTEYKILEKRYLKHLVRSAKHSLFNDSNVKEGFTLMTRALATNPLYTTRIFTTLFVESGKRQFTKDHERI